MSEKICMDCKYCAFDEMGDSICVNSDSENCADWVGFDDTCGEWEAQNDCWAQEIEDKHAKDGGGDI